MRSRVAAMIEHEQPILTAFDQEQRARDVRYIDKNPASMLASYTKQRRNNVKWLKTLSETVLLRTGTHPEVGLISAQDLLRMGVSRSWSSQTDIGDQEIQPLSAHWKYEKVLYPPMGVRLKLVWWRRVSSVW